MKLLLRMELCLEMELTPIFFCSNVGVYGSLYVVECCCVLDRTLQEEGLMEETA